MNTAETIRELRDKSYDSGWISGKIEAGGSYDADAQANCIAQRNELLVELDIRITTLLDALKFYADRENWKVNKSMIYPSEISADGGSIARQALALAEGKEIFDNRGKDK
ncbi:hypothetical protein KA005_83890 [bacterium]|nr:hypothetical protein [bacterium]